MSKKLAEVLVAARCGHPVWVDIRDCSYRHNAERMHRAGDEACLPCRSLAYRRSRLPERVTKLRAAAAAQPVMPDMPPGRIEIISVPDGWKATLATGTIGTAPSPTGAVLAAFAELLEAEHRATKPSPQFGSCQDMLTIVKDDDEHLDAFSEYLP